MDTPDRVALAYSGGLDTSVMIPWLRENYGCEVVAVVADVGQGEDLEAVRGKALETGAVACRVADLRERFVRDHVFPALRAGAVYEGRYLLGTALARPVIARAQVEAARATGCDALAHGCTGKGNDQLRFEAAYGTLAPDLPVIAPWREWDIGSREDAFAYAERHGIPVAASRSRPYSVDRNVWHTSYEGGVLEDPAREAPADLCRRTADPADAPDEPARVEIGFRAGLPTSLDGVELSPLELVEELNGVAGAHGVGRVDLVENRVVGMKSRGVYETPAGTVLVEALRDLEAVALDGDVARHKERVSSRYAELVYRGQWHSPLREALDAFLETASRWVTGTVEMELFKGACRPVARSAPDSLYREDLATFGEAASYDHADAGGFIRLWTLPARVHARVRGEPQPAPGPSPAADPGGGPAENARRDRRGAGPAVDAGDAPASTSDASGPEAATPGDANGGPAPGAVAGPSDDGAPASGPEAGTSGDANAGRDGGGDAGDAPPDASAGGPRPEVPADPVEESTVAP